MPIPSLDRVWSAATATARRFPAVLAVAAVATTAGVVAVELDGGEVWQRLTAIAVLGLPLTVAFTLTAERRGWTGARRLALHGLAVALLAGLYLAWPEWTDEGAARRWLQLAAAFHLLVAVLPYAGTDEPGGFWQYNRTLLFRFVTAVVYAGALFAGLALALAALDQLFGLPVPEKAYLQLWIVLAFLCHPWIFLAEVPDDLAALDAESDYPREVELFTRFVLVPLVTIYLVILTAYAVKVVVTWDWPSGWIGWLVTGAAVAGILAALLIHPLRHAADRPWVRTYGRWFWPALLPSSALLLMAVGQRIGQYGFTEDRYFLAVLAVWLAAVALYYTVRRFERPEVVPWSLCVLALVTFLGPWSAYAVSERSQQGRLEALLERHALVEGDTVRVAEAAVAEEARTEISAIVRYLLNHHGPGAVAPVLGGELPVADSLATSPEAVVSALGIRYVDRARARRGTGRVVLEMETTDRSSPVAGYRAVFRGVSPTRTDSLAVDEAGLTARVDSGGIRLARDGVTVLELSVVGAARRLAATEIDPDSLPPEAMWIRSEAEGVRAGLWLRTLRRLGPPDEDGEPTVSRWSGDLYLGW